MEYKKQMNKNTKSKSLFAQEIEDAIRCSFRGDIYYCDLENDISCDLWTIFVDFISARDKGESYE